MQIIFLLLLCLPVAATFGRPLESHLKREAMFNELIDWEDLEKGEKIVLTESGSPQIRIKGKTKETALLTFNSHKIEVDTEGNFEVIIPLKESPDTLTLQIQAREGFSNTLTILYKWKNKLSTVAPDKNGLARKNPSDYPSDEWLDFTVTSLESNPSALNEEWYRLFKFGGTASYISVGGDSYATVLGWTPTLRFTQWKHRDFGLRGSSTLSFVKFSSSRSFAAFHFNIQGRYLYKDWSIGVGPEFQLWLGDSLVPIGIRTDLDYIISVASLPFMRCIYFSYGIFSVSGYATHQFEGGFRFRM